MIRLIDEILGRQLLGQIFSERSFSRISHAYIEWLDSLYSQIFCTTNGVDTRGLLPPVSENKLSYYPGKYPNYYKPIVPGRIEPVRWNLVRILLTHPWETSSLREMSQGRYPFNDIDKIFNREPSGNGLPLVNSPPSWFVFEQTKSMLRMTIRLHTSCGLNRLSWFWESEQVLRDVADHLAPTKE